MSAPEPFVPANVDLRGLEYMPLLGTHLFGSEFNARATDAEWRAAVTLWWAAWQQKPAGSLPDDDTALCRLADLGRDLKAWRAVRERALHGFVLCADGRLYHEFLCRQVAIAWEKREADRAKARAEADRKSRERMQRAAMFEELHAAGFRVDWNIQTTELRAQITRLREAQSRGQVPPVTRTDASEVTAKTGRDVTGRDETGRDGTGPEEPNPLSADPLGQQTTLHGGGPGPTSRATRLPTDWSLPEEWAADARREAPMITEAGIARTAAMFADYWHSAGGAKARKVDWRATWRNWVRREADRAPAATRPMARVHSLSQAGQSTALALQGFVARGGQGHA